MDSLEEVYHPEASGKNTGADSTSDLIPQLMTNPEYNLACMNLECEKRMGETVW